MTQLNDLDIETTLKLFSELNISKLSLKTEAFDLLLEKAGPPSHLSLTNQIPPQPLPTASSIPVQSNIPSPSNSPEDPDLLYIESPIVGTFYTSPAPGAPPFVTEGQKISKGLPVCIVEAMKVMNKIESELEGEVAKVLLEDGTPVEYGTRMIALRR